MPPLKSDAPPAVTILLEDGTEVDVSGPDAEQIGKGVQDFTVYDTDGKPYQQCGVKGDRKVYRRVQ
jgi:hypothetical protein